MIGETTYTIWFQDGMGRQEFINEERMRWLSHRYGFNAEEVIRSGEAFMWNKGVEPYDNPRSDSDDILGGCFKED